MLHETMVFGTMFLVCGHRSRVDHLQSAHLGWGCGTPYAHACNATGRSGVLPHNPLTDASDALLRGTLGAGVVANTSCFWIETPAEGLVTVLWPRGITGRWNPPRLVDSQGRLIATVGDTLELGGGFTAQPDLRPAVCDVGDQVWTASEIRKP